eukprot:scaffold785_cov95-Cylindrotheca_fusiformis.AAC.1
MLILSINKSIWLFDCNNSEDGSVVAIANPAIGFLTRQVRVFCCDGVTSKWSQHGSATFGENHVDFLGPAVDLSGNGNILDVVATSGKNAKVFHWKEDSGKWEPCLVVVTKVCLGIRFPCPRLLLVPQFRVRFVHIHFGKNNTDWEELAGDIPSVAFRECEALTEVDLFPSAVQVIDDYAFYKCKLLARLGLKEGLERIGKGAFFECESLTSHLRASFSTHTFENNSNI